MNASPRIALLALAAAQLACGEGLPLVERIASVRPLAMRVVVDEPPMRGDLPLRAEALPFETVSLQPLIVDPRGPLDDTRIEAELEPVWLACNLLPTQGLFGCITEAVPLQPADLQECAPPSLDGFDPDDLTMSSGPCLIPVADDESPARPPFTVPIDPTYLLGGDIEVTMVAHRPDETSTPACLRALLGGDDPGNGCLFMTQRVAVGPDAALLELAEQFGVPSSALPPGPDEIPEPNRHPRLLDVRVAAFDGEASDAPMLGTFTPNAGDVIELPWGTRVEIEAEASPDDLQTYLVVGDAGEFTPRDEYYEGAWFVSWGALLSPESDDPLSQNTWTLRAGQQDEDDLPAGGVATLVYVLRDDRQGVTWTHFSVRVTGEPETE
jgi:hypothetical protein